MPHLNISRHVTSRNFQLVRLQTSCDCKLRAEVISKSLFLSQQDFYTRIGYSIRHRDKKKRIKIFLQRQLRHLVANVVSFARRRICSRLRMRTKLGKQDPTRPCRQIEFDVLTSSTNRYRVALRLGSRDCQSSLQCSIAHTVMREYTVVYSRLTITGLVSARTRRN